jgi:hypothetical protein
VNFVAVKTKAGNMKVHWSSLRERARAAQQRDPNRHPVCIAVIPASFADIFSRL